MSASPIPAIFPARSLRPFILVSGVVVLLALLLHSNWKLRSAVRAQIAAHSTQAALVRTTSELARSDHRARANLHLLAEIRHAVERDTPDDPEGLNRRRNLLGPQLDAFYRYRIEATDILDPRPESMRELAAINLELARTLRAVGRLDIAEQPVEEAVARLASLIESQPESDEIRAELVAALEEKSRLHQLLGHREMATLALERALAEANRRVEHQPQHVVARLELAHAQLEIARLWRLDGRVGDARDAIQKANSIANELLQSNPNSRAYLALRQQLVQLENDVPASSENSGLRNQATRSSNR